MQSAAILYPQPPPGQRQTPGCLSFHPVFLALLSHAHQSPCVDPRGWSPSACYREESELFRLSFNSRQHMGAGMQGCTYIPPHPPEVGQMCSVIWPSSEYSEQGEEPHGGGWGLCTVNSCQHTWHICFFLWTMGIPQCRGGEHVPAGV